MSGWHMNFGMGEDYGSYLGWGYGYSITISLKGVTFFKLSLCPYCGNSLHNNTYYVRDIFTGVRIVRCKTCYEILSPDDMRK